MFEPKIVNTQKILIPYILGLFGPLHSPKSDAMLVVVNLRQQHPTFIHETFNSV